MKFEFASSPDLDIMESLAKQIGYRSENNIITFPENIGCGHIKMLDFEPGLKMVFHRHQIAKEMVFKRSAIPVRNNMITITFNTRDKPSVYIQNKDPTSHEIHLSSVYITSTDIGLETHFGANKNIHSTIIIIHSEVLKKFLETHVDNKLLQTITEGNMSFWFDTAMTPGIQKVLREIDDFKDTNNLGILFYKIKLQELIYQLFVELLEKEKRPCTSLNKYDIEKMYLIRENIISALNTPPVLNSLARQIGICETKMKLLFRQIFGKSIYSYYQAARMDEAADLLKHLSVFETGYSLGFANISHFSRLFEKHHHTKPKKFKSLLESKSPLD